MIGLGLAAAVAAASAPAKPVETPADWLRKPSLDDMMTVWPLEALKRGQSGKGVIDCEVSAHGALVDCEVVSEEPAGSNFGRAAKALAPQFLMKPATKDGKPVSGGRARIPINFIWRGGPGAEATKMRAVVSGVVWSKAPSYEDMANAYPAKARAKGVGGAVTLSCAFVADGSLKNCDTANESPRALGFSNAAHSLVGKFAGPTALSDGRSIKDARTQIRFTFPPEMASGGAPMIGKPNWAGVPTSEELKDAIPAAAVTARVARARVVLDCRVVAEGRLDGCRVVSEDPVDLGFGASTLNLSKSFRLTIWTDDGLPSVGGRVRIPIRYDVALPPAAAGAPP